MLFHIPGDNNAFISSKMKAGVTVLLLRDSSLNKCPKTERFMFSSPLLESGLWKGRKSELGRVKDKLDTVKRTG